MRSNRSIVPSLPHPGRVLGLIVAATLLNGLPLDLIGDARLLVGSFAWMPLVLVVPAPWAVLAAGLATVGTVTMFGHPFVLLLSLLEALWLVEARRRARNPVVADLFFWVLVGVPLIWWLYRTMLSTPPSLLAVVATKQVVNQVVAVAVADFLVRYTRLGTFLRDGLAPARRLRALVFNYVFVLTAVPLVLLAVGFSFLLRRSAEVDDERTLLEASRRVASELELFFQLHQSAVQSAASQASAAPEGMGLLLDGMRRAYPDFITMLQADRQGRIVQTAPLEMRERLAGSLVKDREYFTSVRETLMPHVSGVFRGRGFGNDLLVALSAPVLTADGAFNGVVQASVEIGRFSQLIARPGRMADVQFILVDAFGRVIYASPGSGLRSLDSVRAGPLSALVEARTGVETVVYDLTLPGEAPEPMRVYAARCAQIPMVVIAQRPLLAAAWASRDVYLLLAVVFGGVLVTAAIVSKVAGRRLSLPLEHFSGEATRLANAGEVGAITIPAGDEPPHEVELVFSTFNTLALQLQATYEQLRLYNDVLDKRVAERTKEVDRARRAAEAASESKSSFLAMTSHEIRTPLNAIIGLAESLLGQARDPVQVERLRTIQHSGTLLMEVVNDLLDLSRVEAGKLELKPTPVEVGGLCRDVATLLGYRAQLAGLTLDLRMNEAGALWVMVDGKRLRQVLINLVGNAIKFTREGGVVIQVGLTGFMRKRLTLRFSVTDTGPGIPLAKQARLFEPYYRVEGGATDGVAGTGLGLTITRRIVELLGGRMQVVSEEGKGAEFAFELSLPVVEAPPEVVEPAPMAPEAGPTLKPAQGEIERLHVLAADDNLANQEVLRALLEGQCGRLTVVGSAREATDALRGERYDVALIDLEMPDADGTVVASEVSRWSGAESSRQCRLIAVSAHPYSQMAARVQAAGFHDYVEKPISRKRLLAALGLVSPRTGGDTT